jgi:lipoprotein-anchoring transpeptidase ErfK/SrfK
MKKIVVGLSAVVAVGALAACSTAAASTADDHPKIAVAATTSGKSTVDTTTTTAHATTAPTTTKKATPPVTKAPVVQPAAPPVQAQAPAGVPCVAEAKACVDLATRKAWLIENGQVVLGPVSIMPGRPGFRTPVGTFHVLSKVKNYWSHTFNAPMPDAVFFYPGVAFHIGSLGVYSHGCIHLSASSASVFFKTLSIGDEVQVLRG